MVNVTIDHRKIQVPEGTTILKAAATAGIEIPTLCFLKDLNEIGACRICCVEIEGQDTLAAACNTIAEEGMVIHTSSLKAHYARRMNLQIILSQHDFRCAACQRNGSCALQKICADMNINDVPFEQSYERKEWDLSFPLIRDDSKCIKCMRCVQICDKVQSLGIWDIVNTGKRTGVGVSRMRTITEADCALPNINDSGADRDVDVVLTTREFDRLLRSELICPANLEEEEFDSPLGTGSGAAVIFGATGGVMEAALRTAYYALKKENPKPDAFKMVRGLDDIKEVTAEIAGIPIRAAVVHGLGNTRKLIERVAAGEAEYDFVEVMACPGGCAGGGGQPITEGREMAGERGSRLYTLDRKNPLRFSHENPSVRALYSQYLEKPLSHKAHELLHTDHLGWDMPRKV